MMTAQIPDDFERKDTMMIPACPNHFAINSAALKSNQNSQSNTLFKPSELAEDPVERGRCASLISTRHVLVGHPKSSLGQQQLPGDFLHPNRTHHRRPCDGDSPRFVPKRPPLSSLV